MTEFRALRESELDRLDNEAIVDYILAAREAGERESERRAVNVLANAFWPVICAWVRRKVPADDVEDVAQEALLSLLRSTFEGKLVGQFGAILKTITQRRIADYFRGRERRPDVTPLGGEHEGEEGVWAEEPASEDAAASVELRAVVEAVLAGRSELHQEVIRLYGPNVAGFLDLPADEVAARITDGGGEMSPSNVHQIWSRFKRDLRAELDG